MHYVKFTGIVFGKKRSEHDIVQRSSDRRRIFIFVFYFNKKFDF